MRIAKPLLRVATPIGVAAGLREAWRFNPGLAFLMLAMLAVVGVAIGSTVVIVRRERAQERDAVAAGRRIEGELNQGSTRRY
jgi:hypothetical protein